jgi:ribonucleotide reductase beta subunit family protein with ferritin-like domain
MVSIRLAEEFSKVLFEMSKEKTFCAHVDGLTEILGWSQAFCDQYYEKIGNWEAFKTGRENIYNAITLDDLIISYGRDQIDRFYKKKE